MAILSATDGVTEDIYVHAGECPGEQLCPYDVDWIIKRRVELLSEPRLDAPALSSISEGKTIRVLTGQVHTIPGQFVVHRTEGDFSIGDVVVVYTYLGEGHFRIMHSGQMKEANLNFSPGGGSSGSRCDNPQFCFGTLQAELKYQWWLFVRAEDNIEGWVLYSHDHLATVEDY